MRTDKLENERWTRVLDKIAARWRVAYRAGDRAAALRCDIRYNRVLRLREQMVR